MVKTDKPIVTFSNIVHGEPHEGSVNISNTGPNPTFLTTWANCGCTVTKLSKNRLIPGESAELKFTFIPPSIAASIQKDFGVTFVQEDQTYKLVIKIVASVI